MAFNRQERNLSARKSSAPIFRRGIPDNKEGADGDIAYIDIDGVGTVQYVKKENAWTPVTSKLDFTTQGEKVSQANSTNNSFIAQLGFYLDKFRTDITDMVNSMIGSWAVGCNFTINYDYNDNTLKNYLNFNTNYISDSDAYQSFLVPFGCKLKNINFAITVADASESSYVFELLVRSYTTDSSSTTTESTISFTANSPAGQTIRYVNVPVDVSMNISSHYIVTIRQTGFPNNINATKPSKATAYFSKI